MTLYIVDGKAFVPISDDYLICVGEAKFVAKLTEAEIKELTQVIVSLKADIAKNAEKD